MTGSRRYLDTAPFIYFLEKSSLYFDKIRDFFIRCKNQDIPLVTSAMTVEEYCVFRFPNMIVRRSPILTHF